MKSILRFLWVVPVLALGSGLFRGTAQDLLSPAKGSVLLLHSGGTLEGDIRRKGKKYIVHRGIGEAEYPADSVLRLCQDWDDAFAFMKSRANLGDPDERKRLARWCYINKLPEYALAEARAALELRPQDQDARQLVTIFERAVRSQEDNLATPPPQAKTPVPQIDISTESLDLFTDKVQPILLNVCVQCHSGGKGGDFQLQRIHEGGQRVVSQRNLAAVLAQVNVERPQLSPLLNKAVSLHGGQTQAAIRGRHTIPFLTLQEWVDQLIATNPNLQPGDSWPPSKIAGPPPKLSPQALPLFSAAVGDLSPMPRSQPAEASSSGSFGLGGTIVSRMPAGSGEKTPPMKLNRENGIPKPVPFAPVKAPLPEQEPTSRTSNKMPFSDPGLGYEASIARPQPPMPKFSENAVGSPAPRESKTGSFHKTFPKNAPAFPPLAAAPTSPLPPQLHVKQSPPSQLGPPPVPPISFMPPPAQSRVEASPPNPDVDQYDPTDFNKLPLIPVPRLFLVAGDCPKAASGSTTETVVATTSIPH